MTQNDTITIAGLPAWGAQNPLNALLPVSIDGKTVKMTVPQVRGFYSLPPPDPNPSVNVTNLNAAFRAAITSNIGGLIIASPGVYLINDTIEVRNVQGLRFIGSMQTIFIWVGDDATKPVFRLAHCNHCVFDGLYTRTLGAALGQVHILRDNLNGATLTPSHNRIQNSILEGQGHCTYGVLIGGAGAVDANNEYNSFEQVAVSGYKESGFYAPNSQSFGTLMTNCATSGNGGGKYGVDTGNAGAAIHWIGGSFDGHHEADLRLGRSAQAHLIDNPQSENSARMLDVTLDFRFQIHVRGFRWTGTGLHTDGKVIKTNMSGLLTLDSCTIGEGNTPTRNMTMEFLNMTNPIAGAIRLKNTVVISSANKVFTGDVQCVAVDGGHQMVSEVPPQYRVLSVN